MAKKAKNSENAESADSAETENIKTDSEVQDVADGETALSETDSLKTELQRMTEYAQRVTADMENIKKRNKNVASEMYNEGKKDAVLKLLPVLDNMERAFSVEMDEGVKTGLNNIVKMFVAELNKLGVTEIEAMGLELDPNLHNVLMQVDDAEHSGKIVNVFEKGYKLDDKVLRHAGVVVAK